MARIRSLKPEAFQSETLSLVSLAAERTFFGLSTIADDRGRLADKPAQINGDLWSMRGNHAPADLEQELAEMAALEEPLVCRYVGCNGKRYLHLVTWDGHQKIDRASKSRQPRCPIHQGEPDDYCGLHDGNCPVPSRDTREPSRASEQPETGHAEPSGTPPAAGGKAVGSDGAPSNGAGSGQVADLGVHQSSRDTREPSMLDLGSRTVDRGSRTVDLPPTAGGETPPDPDEATAQTILAEYIERCRKRPPADVLGQLGKYIRKMLGEGIEPDDIRRGMARWKALGINPSGLQGVVNQVMNPSDAPPAGVATSDRKAAETQALKGQIKPSRPGIAAGGPPNTIQGRVEH